MNWNKHSSAYNWTCDKCRTLVQAFSHSLFSELKEKHQKECNPKTIQQNIEEILKDLDSYSEFDDGFNAKFNLRRLVLVVKELDLKFKKEMNGEKND
jgi:hypothetical protein